MHRIGTLVLNGLDALSNLLRTRNLIWKGIKCGTEDWGWGGGRRSPWRCWSARLPIGLIGLIGRFGLLGHIDHISLVGSLASGSSVASSAKSALSASAASSAKSASSTYQLRQITLAHWPHWHHRLWPHCLLSLSGFGSSAYWPSQPRWLMDSSAVLWVSHRSRNRGSKNNMAAQASSNHVELPQCRLALAKLTMQQYLIITPPHRFTWVSMWGSRRYVVVACSREETYVVVDFLFWQILPWWCATIHKTIIFSQASANVTIYCVMREWCDNIHSWISTVQTGG